MSKKKSHCAPRIWQKFNLLEKLVWNDLYDSFIQCPEVFAVGWDGKEDQEKRNITAHNMACQGVWALQSLLKDYTEKSRSLQNRIKSLS